MTSLGHLWRAVRVTVENSRALSAAHRAYQRGETIPKIVGAWAAETANELDDLVPDEIAKALGKGSEYLERAAVACVGLALRVEAFAPEVTSRLDRVAAWAEATGPVAIRIIRQGSDLTRSVAPRVVGLAGQAAQTAGRVAEKMRTLRGDS